MNSYQRQKQKYEARIAKLEADLRILVYKPDSSEAMSVKLHVVMSDQQVEMAFFGVMTQPRPFESTTANGLFKFIKAYK